MSKYFRRPSPYAGHTRVPDWIGKDPLLGFRERDLFCLMHTLSYKVDKLIGYRCGFWSLTNLGLKLSGDDAKARDLERPLVLSGHTVKKLARRLRLKKYLWTWRLRRTDDTYHTMSTNLYVLKPGNMTGDAFWRACNANINAHRINSYLLMAKSCLRAGKDP